MSNIIKTPTGRTLFSNLTKPTVFSPDGKLQPTEDNPGHFETLLVLDRTKPEVVAFLEQLSEMAEEAAQSQGTGQRRDPLYSLTDDVDENKQPTGAVRLKLRVSAGGRTKKGQVFSREVVFVDHNGKPFTPEAEFANGSQIRCSLELRAYKTAGFIGVSLRLRAVQVIAAEYYRPATSAVDDFANDVVDPESFDTGADF